MIYTISNVLVRVPMIVWQIMVIYELYLLNRKKKQTHLISFFKGVVLCFLLTQCVHLVSYVMLSLIKCGGTVETQLYIDEMLGVNIRNIILYIFYVGAKLYHERTRKEKFIQISLISCIFAVIQIVFYYYLFLSNPDGLTEQIIGIATVCSIVVLFVHGAMLELMGQIVKNQKRQSEEEKRLLEKKYEHDYYLLTKEQEESIGRIQEEMRSQIEAVQKLMSERNEEKRKEAEKLLLKMEEDVNQFGRVYYCSDPVLNTILSLKQEKAKKMGIEMDVRVDSIAKTALEDIDLCSVSTNLLDNAIEATERIKDLKQNESIEHAIAVRVGVRGGYLVLRVDNPMEEKPRKNKKGHFISSKKETGSIKKHGRGVRIVETTLEKCGGYLDLKEETNMFYATAFIPIEGK